MYNHTVKWIKMHFIGLMQSRKVPSSVDQGFSN